MNKINMKPYLCRTWAMFGNDGEFHEGHKILDQI